MAGYHPLSTKAVQTFLTALTKCFMAVANALLPISVLVPGVVNNNKWNKESDNNKSPPLQINLSLFLVI